MPAATLNKDNFQTEVLESKMPYLVDFWAVWCGPCRIVSPAIEAVADANVGKVGIGKVNVDENAELAQRYNILSIPSLVIFKDGKPVDQLVGVHSQEEIQNTLNAHM